MIGLTDYKISGFLKEEQIYFIVWFVRLYVEKV